MGRLAIGLALISGCPSSTTAPDAAGPPPPDAGLDSGFDAGIPTGGPELLEAYFDAIDAEHCRAGVRCESAVVLVYDPLTWPWEQAACHPAFERVPRNKRAIRRRAIRAALAAGRVSFDEAAGRACIELLPWFDSCPESGGPELPAACQDAIRPEVGRGAPCRPAGVDPVVAFNVECSAGLRCDAADGCDGTCEPLAAEGEPCIYRECADGLHCEGRVCRPPGGLGESCSLLLDDCAAGTQCVLGRCEVPVAPGEPCDPGRYDCRYPARCWAGSDGVSRCTEPADLPAGSPCGWQGPCGPDLACFDIDRATLTGTCMPSRTEGQACSDTEKCGPWLRCVDGLCRRIAMPHESCDGTNVVCPLTHHCSPEDTCDPLPLLGQLCGDATRCFHGECLGDHCELLPTGAECDDDYLSPLGSCEGFCSSAVMGLCLDPVVEGEACGSGFGSQCGPGLGCPDYWRPVGCVPWCGRHEEPAR
jgi:hypothetical protein